MQSRLSPLWLDLIIDSGGRVSVSLGDALALLRAETGRSKLLRFPASARRFPVFTPENFPVRQKNSRFASHREFRRNLLQHRVLVRGEWVTIPFEFTKFPILFPDGREFVPMRPVRCGLHPPPRTPIRTGVSKSLTNSPQYAGISRVQRTDGRSLLPAETAIASILASSLWAPQTRSWRRPA